MSGPKCLRCGAESAWTKGRVPADGSLADKIDELERENNRWRAAAKKLLENYQPNDRVFVEEVQELKDLLNSNH